MDWMKKALLLLVLAGPAPLAAQTGGTLAPYIASDGSVAGSPVVIGANYTREYGWLALRVGGGIDTGSTPWGGKSEEGTTRLGLFSGDLDALLYYGSPASPDPTVIPYVLAGVGVQGRSGAIHSSFATTYSFGAGIRTPVTNWLTLDGET